MVREAAPLGRRARGVRAAAVRARPQQQPRAHAWAYALPACARRLGRALRARGRRVGVGSAAGLVAAAVAAVAAAPVVAKGLLSPTQDADARAEVARLAAAGAWNLGQWDAFESYSKSLRKDTLETDFFCAVLDVNCGCAPVPARASNMHSLPCARARVSCSPRRVSRQISRRISARAAASTRQERGSTGRGRGWTRS